MVSMRALALVQGSHVINFAVIATVAMDFIGILSWMTLQQRRKDLCKRFCDPVLLWSGGGIARNFPANHYPFRASSSFLYFAGQPLTNAVLALQAGETSLYWDEAPPSDALWHGTTPSRREMAIALELDHVYPLSELNYWSGKPFATVRAQDLKTQAWQASLTGGFSNTFLQHEQQLAAAITSLRLQHDESAIAQINEAVAVTVAAHLAGMTVTTQAQTEAQVRASIESVFMAHNMSPAYGSIVTVQGDVLHNQQYHHQLHPGDLLLVDAGAETALGWASDVTRTWPVSGRFSATQRALYAVVLAAHDACIEAIQPGVEYCDLHGLATRVLAEGLLDLGLLKGTLESLLEQDVPAYFFPHGIGHLLGLDVHDMEEFGDLAGYASGRSRSDRRSLQYLRLNRPLLENMVVTIEPGFYQIPALLQEAQDTPLIRDCIDWTRLEQFSDVRGIRIEDDIWVTDHGSQVLTSDLPTDCDRISEVLLDTAR